MNAAYNVSHVNAGKLLVNIRRVLANAGNNSVFWVMPVMGFEEVLYLLVIVPFAAGRRN